VKTRFEILSILAAAVLTSFPAAAQDAPKKNAAAENIARGTVGGGAQTLNKSTGSLTGWWNFPVAGGTNKVKITASGCKFQEATGKFFCPTVLRQVEKAAPGYSGPMSDKMPVYVGTSGGTRIVSITN